MGFYMGQIISTGFDYAPQGAARCDGALLPIPNYDALYNLLGTKYGGDGKMSFALPNLIASDEKTGLYSYIVLEGEYPIAS